MFRVRSDIISLHVIIFSVIKRSFRELILLHETYNWDT